MDLVTFEPGMTTGTRLGGNGRQRESMGGNGRQREAMGGSGFSNFRAGNHHWDTLGRRREATGGNGRQREAVDLVTFVLGLTTGQSWEASLGGNGRQCICQLSAWESLMGQAFEASLGGNGRQWIW